MKYQKGKSTCNDNELAAWMKHKLYMADKK